MCIVYLRLLPILQLHHRVKQRLDYIYTPTTKSINSSAFRSACIIALYDCVSVVSICGFKSILMVQPFQRIAANRCQRRHILGTILV